MVSITASSLINRSRMKIFNVSLIRSPTLNPKIKISLNIFLSWIEIFWVFSSCSSMWWKIWGEINAVLQIFTWIKLSRSTVGALKNKVCLWWNSCRRFCRVALVVSFFNRSISPYRSSKSASENDEISLSCVACSQWTANCENMVFRELCLIGWKSARISLRLNRCCCWIIWLRRSSWGSVTFERRMLHSSKRSKAGDCSLAYNSMSWSL